MKLGRTATAAVVLLACAVAYSAAPLARAEESLGDKIKKIFEPTPTASPKKRKNSTSKKSTTKPTPSATKSKSLATPKPTASPKVSASPTATPSPQPSAPPQDSPSPSGSAKGKKKKSSPSPTPTASPKASASPSLEDSATPSPDEAPALDATPVAKKGKASGATITPEDIEGLDSYKPEVRKIIDIALGLTTQNLVYKYGSADPANGGLDCSGFVYYVLNQIGAKDVPRDSGGQYMWVRKSGDFKAVISRSDDTFELDELKPGDLMFWTGTYSVQRDPPITHAMIYLGREKKTNQRIMVGASDGRTYHGQSRFGVGVFDFKLSRSSKAETSGRRPAFVGYGRIPGLGDG